MTFFYVYIMNFSHFLQYFLLFSQMRNFSSRLFSLNSYTQKGYFLSILLFLSLLLFLFLFSFYLFSLVLFIQTLSLILFLLSSFLSVFQHLLDLQVMHQGWFLWVNPFYCLFSRIASRPPPGAGMSPPFFLLYIFAQVRLFPLVSDFIFSLR